MGNLKYRLAVSGDEEKILYFINKLAVYEKMQDLVIATPSDIKNWLFDKKIAKVIFALDGEKEVGFALFFYNFSTFLGKAGIYLEDLFVLPEYRGKGYGKGLLKELAKIAVKENLGRLEWCCLNWNKPSIDFYITLGATPMDEWTTFRLTGETLNNLARE